VHYKNAVLSKNVVKTNEKIADNLTRMFKEGPLVSFNGSPTVSPITAALCSSDFFFLTYPLTVNCPDSMYFLALSQAPPELADDIAILHPETKIPGKTPATAVGPNTTPTNKGVPKTIVAGKNISCKADLVAI
jgi:hypothetical protein